MITVRVIITAPFRAAWFLVTLPFLVILWLLALLKRTVLAIASVPVYYLGRLRRRAAVVWDWTKERRSRARLSLPWWGQSCGLKATQSTQTLQDEEEYETVYSTPLPLPLPPSTPTQSDLITLHHRYPLLNPDLLLKLQKLARKRSLSDAHRQAILSLLTLYLEQTSPAGTPVQSPSESGREEEDDEEEKETEKKDAATAVGSVPLQSVKDEKSLRLILELMSISNTSASVRQYAESQRQRARGSASVYQYDRQKLQELIAELDQVSFEEGSKKSRRSKKKPSQHQTLRHRLPTRRSPAYHSPPRHSKSRHAHWSSPPSPLSHPESDSDSQSEACVTAEESLRRLSDEEGHSSEFQSPLEEFSESETEEEEEEEEERSRGRHIRSLEREERERSRKGRERREERERERKAREEHERRREKERERERGREREKEEREKTTTSSPHGSKPSPSAPLCGQEEGEEKMNRSLGSHGYTGVLSPVQESPEYTRTPSIHDSADELENDLNRALLQLNTETTDLKADEKEVEIIEQTAARMTPVQRLGESGSGCASPTTPNTVVWERGTCVIVSSTPAVQEEEGKKEEEGKGEGKEEEVKKLGKAKNEKAAVEEDDDKKLVIRKEDGGVEREGAKAEKHEVFSDIPKVVPSLGLKEGHDRQQLAVARSSQRRRPPSRHPSSPDKGSSPKASYLEDAEMEQLELQLKQSVDSLDLLLGKKEKATEKQRELKKSEEKDEDEEEEEEEESLSDNEEEEEEGGSSAVHKKLPGAVRVLPSLSDQMQLLKPGSLEQDVRELSPESLLEESLTSITQPLSTGSETVPSSQTVPSHTTSATAKSTTPQASTSAPNTPPSAATTDTPSAATTDTTVPAAASQQSTPTRPQGSPRPRSNSFDSGTRLAGNSAQGAAGASSKPLMIPSSQPPWIEMRKTPAMPLQPLPPKPPLHMLTPHQSAEPRRTRSSSDPQLTDSVYDVLPKSPNPTKLEQYQAEEDSIYDCLQPYQKDDRIYDVTPIKYLHQTVKSDTAGSPGSPVLPSRAQKLREEESGKEERRRRSGSGSEKSRSSRDSRSQEKEREGHSSRHHSNSSDRESHHTRHRSSEKHSSSEKRSRGHSSERKHRSHSGDREKHSKSKDSSSSGRKHSSNSKSSGDRKESSSSSKKASSSKEKESKSSSKSSSRSKSEKSEGSKSKSDSSRGAKSEKEKRRRSSEKSSGSKEEEREDLLPTIPRSSSRFSIVSTGAISSSPKEEGIKKSTSLSSLFTSKGRSKSGAKPKTDEKGTLV